MGSKKNKGKKKSQNNKPNKTTNNTVTEDNVKNKISILTVSQVKRIPFLHNLSRMIEYQIDVEISEWVITNGSTTDEEFDEFNEKIKDITCKVPIKNVSDKNLSYRNIGAFRNINGFRSRSYEGVGFK